jgi:hypothetical protein
MNNVLKVFHKINEGLTRIETAPRGEAARIAEALKQINEELCDKFIEILNDRNDRGTTQTSSNS